MTAAGERAGVTRSAVLAIALIAGFGAIYAGLAYFAFDRFPYSGDEYSLALQAELFARGQLHAPAPPNPEWLRIDHVVIDQLVRSKYPPGAAVLLALGERWGAAWLVTPLEGVVCLAIVWLTVRRILGPREGLIALVAVGLAPLFAFEAASFYAHTASLVFLAIAFAAIAAWTRSARIAWLIVTGAALGCAFLTRPLDALLFGLALVALRSWRAVIVPALAAVPFAVVNLWYQARQFGSPLRDGYQAFQPTMEALYGAETAAPQLGIGNLWDPIQLWNHLDVLRAFAITWTLPGAVVVALFGAQAIGRDHPARPVRTFSLAVIAVYAAVLLITIVDPDDGPRPRYLSPLLIPLALLTAAGFAPVTAALVAQFGRRIRSIVVATAVTFALVQLGAHVYDRVPLVWQREGLFTAARVAGMTDAVVIVRARHPSRFARNGPWFDRPILYLSVPAEVGVDAVRAAYPGRAIWEAHEGTPWTLTRVD